MNLQELAVWIPPLLLAITFHESMHGYVAYRLGDPTAKAMGRLTLNPLAHIDLMGTVIVPIMLFIMRASFLFGWAKPVPVNFFRLRNPKRDMIWVAAAGPLTNLVLAFFSGLLFQLLVFLDPMSTQGGMGVLNFFKAMAIVSVKFNVLLALFNMIPIPPLDGGRILVGVLPREQAITVSRIEPYGFFIVVGLIMLNPLGIMSVLWRFMAGLTNTFLGF